MKAMGSIIGYVCKGGFFVGIFWAILIFIVPMTCNADCEGTNDFTLRVILKDSIPVTVRDLAKYFRVISVRDDSGDPLIQERTLRVKQGYRLEVEFRQGLDIFKFAKPVRATLCAPVYLEKKVEVIRVAGDDLAGRRGTIRIAKERSGLELKEDGTIVNLKHDREVLDESLPLMFHQDIVAWAERIIGMKPGSQQRHLTCA